MEYNFKKENFYRGVMSRNARASKVGTDLIRAEMKREGWTQAAVVQEVNFSRSTLNQILSGQSVRLENLEELCYLFELEVGQVLEKKDSNEIDLVVQRLREMSTESLRKRCGTMRILDMTQPIDSAAIYTDVNILKQVTGKTRQEIQKMQLSPDDSMEHFDQFFSGGVKQERVEGLKAVLDKRALMILGRPGSGKTTFLKRLVILCLKEEFLPDRLPIFVTLKEFAEAEGQPGIIDFMCGDRTALIQILKDGRTLVLLDGLDEVMEEDQDRVIKEIREFAETYDKNHIVITCRIAAKEYIFQQFTEVEIADFDDRQIQIFVNKWFKTKEENSESNTGQMFWGELEKDKSVKELATNPLLLTLLCLEFDDTSGFPQSRSELYERALNVLLAKWDGQRRIKRDEIYEGLSRKRKETLLGQLAMHTFERGDYFFTERVATQQIEKFIRNLPGAGEELEADSRVVLKAIESQHGLLVERARGIYSFSHLTFHEYFTAQYISEISHPSSREAIINQLVANITEKRWQEVILLVAERLESADYLLQKMHTSINELMMGYEKLQGLLTWVTTRAEQLKAESNPSCKPAAIRAYYYGTVLDTALAKTPEIALTLRFAFDVASILDLALYFNFFLKNDLRSRIQSLKDNLPNRNNHKTFKQWWQVHGEKWTGEFCEVMNRDEIYDWQLTDEEQKKLQQYYYATRLLFDCLHSKCYISREVREEIEATMLLPIKAIEQWRKENGRA